MAQHADLIKRLEYRIGYYTGTAAKVMRMWIKHARQGFDLHMKRL